MVLSLYTQGDLVAPRQVFGKCGYVVEAKEGHCLIRVGKELINVPERELILISARNIPNLRLIAEKIWQAQAILTFDRDLGHAIMAYLGSGSVVSRAFSDYILKIPSPILHQCLKEMAVIGCEVEVSVATVLGLNFDLLSGKT